MSVKMTLFAAVALAAALLRGGAVSLDGEWELCYFPQPEDGAIRSLPLKVKYERVKATVPGNCEMSVTLADGTPVVSGETEVEEGAQVVMTIVPAEGYEVKTVKVTEVAAEPVTGDGAPRRAAGDEVNVTAGEADNTYVFNMPANGVNVDVTVDEISVVTAIDDINAASNGNVKYVNAMGQVSDRPFNGFNIVINGEKTYKMIVK